MQSGEIEDYCERVSAVKPLVVYGKVVQVVGLTIEATGPPMRIGDLCFVEQPGGKRTPVEVVGFRDDRILLMPLGELEGIGPDSLLIPTFKPQRVRVGKDLLGRVIGPMGDPIDEGPRIRGEASVPLSASPPHPLKRRRIVEPVATGIRALDGCATCGKGQRLAILSGSGLGKSKLIGMVARNTNADLNVIALVGERGREVRDFIEADLGEDGLARSIVVVATSDQPALLRLKGAYLATAIAEWFREQGLDVMLMVDSLTRLAMAQREIGLAIGEPPTTKGYPPSVFALLPKLLERTGTSEKGSITAFYAVLVEADDINDPIGDTVRSIVDGHVVLSRALTSRGHYPAVDVLNTLSRVMIDVTSKEHQAMATEIRRMLAIYRDAEDLVNIGAYAQGSNPEIDTALRLMPRIRAFLQQGLFESSNFDEIEALMSSALQG